jgi:hypothetical protein
MENKYDQLKTDVRDKKKDRSILGFAGEFPFG